MGGSAFGKLVAIFLLAASMLGAPADGRVIAMPGAARTTAQIAQLRRPSPEKISQRQGYAIGFFVHEIGTGPNKTVWDVASSENTLTSPSSFGLIQVVDNPITNVPELDSIPLGRVQGTIAFADLRETALSVNLNIIFTEEIFHKGSTLHVLGRLPVSGKWRDEMLSIVGGTGSFVEAQGTAFSSYYSYDPSTKYRVSTYVLFFHAG